MTSSGNDFGKAAFQAQLSMRQSDEEVIIRPVFWFPIRIFFTSASVFPFAVSPSSRNIAAHV